MTLSSLIIVVIFLIFLYFGYIEDYKKDKNNFKKTMFFVIGLFSISALGYFISIYYTPLAKEKISNYYWEIEAKDSLKHLSQIDTTFEQKINRSMVVNKKVDTFVNRIENLYFLLLFLMQYILHKYLKIRYG